jgi:hypothetical protein
MQCGNKQHQWPRGAFKTSSLQGCTQQAAVPIFKQMRLVDACMPNGEGPRPELGPDTRHLRRGVLKWRCTACCIVHERFAFLSQDAVGSDPPLSKKFRLFCWSQCSPDRLFWVRATGHSQGGALKWRSRSALERDVLSVASLSCDAVGAGPPFCEGSSYPPRLSVHLLAPLHDLQPCPRG